MSKPWTEQNVCNAMAEIVTQAANDPALYQKCLANPLSVLKDDWDLEVPPNYAVKFKEADTAILVTTLLPVGTPPPSDPMGPANHTPDYGILCTTKPW